MTPIDCFSRSPQAERCEQVKGHIGDHSCVLSTGRVFWPNKPRIWKLALWHPFKMVFHASDHEEDNDTELIEVVDLKPVRELLTNMKREMKNNHWYHFSQDTRDRFDALLEKVTE